MPVPYAFANAAVSLPLSQLDANFNTPIILGNTAVQLGNTVTALNNLTLGNVTITTNPAAPITANGGGTGLTSPGTVGNVLTSTGTAWVSSAVPGGGNGAPVSASYVLVSSDANLTSGRVLTAGANVTITDNGPGNTVVINSSGGGGGGSGLTLIATLTPTNGTSSISSTGLSSYKSIVVLVDNITLSGGAALSFAISSNNGSTYSNPVTVFTNNNNSTPKGFLQIYNTASSSTNKVGFFISFFQSGNFAITDVTGIVNAVQIAVYVGQTFTGTGNIYLYGMN